MATLAAAQLAAEVAHLKRRLAAVERASQMANTSIEGGAVTVYDTDGTVRGVIGIQPDGTNAVVTVNDPTPPAPSAAILEPVSGGLAVTWDGTFVGGAPKPGDFRCVKVHAGSGAEDFSPSSPTLRAALIAAGTVTIALPADPYTVILVTETTGGATSEASLFATETPAPASDGVDQAARNAATAAQDVADAAVARAQAAEEAAQAAQASADTVSGQVATAQQAAEDADASAQSALSQAQTAQETGTSAQQAADLAKAAADAARDAAAAAGTSAAQASSAAADAAAQAAQAIANAATAAGTASSALASANGKVTYFTSATKPTYSGAADTAVWIDTANGRRLNRWNGTDFETQQFGNLALQPGSIVASDVLVQGSVSAALLKADAIDGKTITGATVRTAANGQRLVLDSTNGLRGYGADGTTVNTQVGTDGKLTAVGAQITGTLDTGASTSGPGVKLSNSGTNPATGTVEWRTGAMDANATIALTGGGSGGSSYEINGGKAIGVKAPRITLDVAALAQGGYGPVMRLQAGAGGRISPDTWLDPAVAVGPFPGGAFIVPYALTANYYNVPRFAKLASGQVVLTGMLAYTGATLARGTALGTLPAGCRPARVILGLAIGGNDRPWRWQIDPNGNVYFQAPAAADWSFTTGDGNGYLSLDGIAFMAADVNPA